MKHFWLLACCAVALIGAGGCASTGSSGFWANPFRPVAKTENCAPEAPSTTPPVPPDQMAQAKSGDGKATDAKAAETKTAETKATIPADSSNPFRKPGEIAAAPATATSVGGAAAPQTQTAAKIDTTGPASGSAAALTFRPEVLALIDSELRDASPEEKASWYDQLKKVDPALVPELLRVRRLSIQIAERNTQAEDAVLAATARRPQPQPLQPAAGSLGQSNPWSQPAGLTPKTPAPQTATGTGIQLMQHSETTPQNSVVHASGAFDDPLAARRVQPVMHQVEDPGQTASLQPVHATAQTGGPVQTPYGLSQPAAIGGPAPAASGSQANLPARVGPSGAAAGTVAAVTSGVKSGGPTWKADLERVISLAEQDVATAQPGTTAESRHAYLRKHVYLRMLYLMAEHPERALTAVPGVDPADQEFLQQLFWAVSNYLDSEHIPSERDRAAQTLAQLNNAAQRLREKSDLEIHNLAFCEQIQYFGNYQRFPRDEFNPGQETLLYAELQNFKSEPTGDGQYRTVLRSLLEILGPTGEVRWQKDFPATEDLCRTPRRDYFHNYQFAIPNNLPLGPHTLKLTVFDELSGKMASYTLNFLVR